MTKQLQLPSFKYVPFAYDVGIFKKETFVCDICGQDQYYRYVGPYYVEKEHSTGTFKVTNEESKICAFCIESGKAAEKLNVDFKDVEILEQTCYYKEKLDEEFCESRIRTWLYHTPNFKGLETELWPICCSNFTAFIGYLGTGDKYIQDLNFEGSKNASEITAHLQGKSVDLLFQDLQEPLEIEAHRLHYSGIDVKNGSTLANRLKKEENSAIGYLFKCLECGKFHVHVDLIPKI